INTLESSPNKHLIEITNGGNETLPDNTSKRDNCIGTGSTVFYNAYEVRDPDDRPSLIGLAHELLGHSYDFDQGRFDNSLTNYGKNSSGIHTGVPMYEVSAVNIENIARAAEHKKLRTTYEDIDLLGTKVPIPDK